MKKTGIEVHVDIEIAHPASATFALISDFARNPEWQDGMVECVWLTENHDIGGRYRQKARFMGKDIFSEFEVLEYTAGQRVKATTISGSFPITFTRKVTATAGGSRVQALIEGDATGFFRLMKPLMYWMVNRSIQKDYRKLKVLLEGFAKQNE